MPRLSVDSIVDIRINMATGMSVSDNGCNIGLILGPSTPITTTVRMKRYADLDAVIEDFTTENLPERLAAEKYFAQMPKPAALYIGRINRAEQNGESPVAAYNACKEMSNDFFGVYVCGASDAENAAMAAAMDAAGDTCLFFDTDNSDALVASPTNADVFTTMVNNGYTNAIGIYSASDYAGAALMGRAMGLETGEANSAFDLFLKSMNDIDPSSSITASQLAILEGKNGNAYIVRGQDVRMIETGNCVDGTPYDQMMYLVLTKKVLQDAVLQQMTRDGVAKIPQTDDGVAMIVSAITTGMEYMRDLGFIGPGVWTADPFRGLKTGDMLDSGYQIFADSFSDMSAADREARRAPNIYVAMKLAGSVRSVIIGLNVNA